MAPTIATHLLMPDVAEFAKLHPEVEMSVLSLDEPVNLTNREADPARPTRHPSAPRQRIAALQSL